MAGQAVIGVVKCVWQTACRVEDSRIHGRSVLVGCLLRSVWVCGKHRAVLVTLCMRWAMLAVLAASVLLRLRCRGVWSPSQRPRRRDTPDLANARVDEQTNKDRNVCGCEVRGLTLEFGSLMCACVCCVFSQLMNIVYALCVLFDIDSLSTLPPLHSPYITPNYLLLLCLFWLACRAHSPTSRRLHRRCCFD